MKKAEMTLEVIAGIILVLLVLVVLAFAFRTQISNLFSSFSQLIKGTADTTQNISLSSLGG